MYCSGCGKLFSRPTIDGHVVKTGRMRKYCENCRPVGLTKKKKEDPNGDSVCSICGKKYNYNRKKGHTTTKCGTCIVNIRRFQVKNRAIAYKGGKCEVCGYNKCVRALVFHHKDVSQKDFSLGGNHCRKWKNIQAELDKCSLLCSNCHAEEHKKLDQVGKTVKPTTLWDTQEAWDLPVKQVAVGSNPARCSQIIPD